MSAIEVMQEVGRILMTIPEPFLMILTGIVLLILATLARSHQQTLPGRRCPETGFGKQHIQINSRGRAPCKEI